ncbi:hypothetical protein D3C85_1632550 [compost metagenome]
MIEAWFNASEIMASSGPSRVSNRPPLASKQEEYRMASSIPRKSASFFSSCLWLSWVPQIKRTEAMPKPWLSIPALAAAIIAGWLARPR